MAPTPTSDAIKEVNETIERIRAGWWALATQKAIERGSDAVEKQDVDAAWEEMVLEFAP